MDSAPLHLLCYCLLEGSGFAALMELAEVPREMLEAELASLRLQVQQQRVDQEVRHAVYRDCASIAIQVSELREEFKETVAAIVRGFNTLTTALLQQCGRAATTLHSLTDELENLRGYVVNVAEQLSSSVNQLCTNPFVDREESRLVHGLHKCVSSLCTTATRERLHRSDDFTAVAPLSWNTLGSLKEAAPHAIAALTVCRDHLAYVYNTSELTHRRAEATEKSYQAIKTELDALKRGLVQFIGDAEREHHLTAKLCFSNEADSRCALSTESTASDFLVALTRIHRLHVSEELIVMHSNAARHQTLSKLHTPKVEVVQPPQPPNNPRNAAEALLRKKCARLQFRLCAQLVLKDLLKFRCRRVLAIHSVHYRSLRMASSEQTNRIGALAAELERALKRDVRTAVQIAQVPLSAYPSSAMHSPSHSLQSYWKLSNSAVPAPSPPLIATPVPPKGTFREYVQRLGSAAKSPHQTDTRRAMVVTSPPSQQVGASVR